jgi:Bacterial dnaA protein helix-turn-helix
MPQEVRAGRGLSIMETCHICAAELPIGKVSAIIHRVSCASGVSQKLITSKRRNLKYVRPRQAAYWLAHQETDSSSPEIGRRIGGRDHSTILHGITRAEELIATDCVFADLVSRAASRQNDEPELPLILTDDSSSNTAHQNSTIGISL